MPFIAITLATNSSRATTLTIEDYHGLTLAALGADPEAFDRVEEIRELASSPEVRSLATDNAHTGSSSLVVNDGSGDVPQADVLRFLDSLLLESTENAHNVVKRDSSGQLSDSVTWDGSATQSGVKLGGDMDANTQKITSLSPGTSGTDAVNLNQLNAVVAGLSPKGSVKALADSNQAITGIPTTIDSIGSWVDSELILLVAQTSGVQNGIWEVHAGAWTRPTNFATGSDAASAHVFVQQGATYAEQQWLCTDDTGSAVVDTDVLTWQQHGGGSSAIRKEITFGASQRVPKQGAPATLYLELPGSVSSIKTERRMIRSGTITGAAIQVDTVDATRAYKLSVRINGSEVALVALGTSTLGAESSSLSVAYSSGDLLSTAVIHTSGVAAKSDFGDITAVVEVTEVS